MDGELKILFTGGDDPRNTSEAFLREFRGDILVELADGRRFDVVVFTPRRIAQELETKSEYNQPYFAEAAMIVLPEITTENITLAVRALVAEGFFDQFVPRRD